MDNQLIAAAGVVASVAFGYIGYRRGLLKDASSTGKEHGGLMADIEYIKRRSDDLLLEFKDANKTLGNHAERLTRVEESAKSAHHRIDRIERGE